MRKAELCAAVAALMLASAPMVGCGGERAAGEGGARSAAAEEPDDSVLPRPAGVALPAGVTAEMAAEGRRLFGTTCVVCHGPDAAGTQLGPSLRDGEWLNVSWDFAEIERLIHQGVPRPERYPVPMPPGGGGAFTPEQVRSLAAYVYSLGQGKTRPAEADTAGG